MNHNFGEKQKEYSTKQKQDIPVWISPKFEVSRKKAIEVIDSGLYGLEDGDFWILMNETKSGKMAYTGLITSHNACLKINDALKPELKFRPSCVTCDKEGYKDSLVFTYCCDEQGIYEVGEASKDNCSNPYPYAMAYKRLMDRVVLKNSKLAFAGVYSEAEADEFSQPIVEESRNVVGPGKQATKPVEKPIEKTVKTPEPTNQATVVKVGKEHIDAFGAMCARKGVRPSEYGLKFHLKRVTEMTMDQFREAMDEMEGRPDAV